MSWKSWNWVYSRARAPKQYVLLHYFTWSGELVSVNSHHFHDFHETHWFPWNHHKIIKSADFAVLVRNSMISPKGACGYLWIRLYIVSPTAPAAKGTTFGHENHKSHILWKSVKTCGNHHFYGKVWNSRKIHQKATFRARGRKQQ